jgi:outer membrane murein-binding lipoprotein Lpp
VYRLIPITILLAAGYLLFGNRGCEQSVSPAAYYQVRHLTAENQDLRGQINDLAELQAQTLSELKAARRSAARADIDLRSAYLGYAPLGVVLVILGGGLAAICFFVIRRRRGGSV